MAQKVYLKKSAVVDKTPSASNLEFGELAINYASGNGKSFLAHKKYDGTIAKYHEDTYFESQYATKDALEDVESDTAAALNAAHSAFTYASAISATVKSTYWTSATTKSKIDEAKNAAVTSAYNASVASAKAYTDGLADFVKTYSSTTDSTLATLKSSATTLSGWVTDLYSKVGNYATHDEVKNASGNAITSAITSAKSYADSTFFTKTSAGTAYDTLNTAASNARSAANSAFTYASAISATVKNNFATKSEVGSASANAITSAITSAKSYVDTNYATNTRVQNVEGDVATLKASAETLNNRFTSVYTYKGSVANFALLPNSGKVVGYVYNVVAANGNIPAGTNYAWNGTEWDALGGTVDLSNYATTGSMGTFSAGVVTRFTTNETDAANARAAANSAFTYASAISATVKNSFATKAEVTTASGNAISSAITSAKSYVDSTFVKNSVYGSFSSTTNESLSNLSGKIGFIDGKYVSGVSITTTGTAASVDNHVIKIPVVNSDAALAFGESKTIATIGGVNVTASLPEGGYQGPQGPKGSQGPAGTNGTNGTNGTDGAQGPQGPTGAQGNKGDQGPQGPKGQNGNDATGVQGPQGPKGQNGNDATGVQGPQGPKGSQGPQGPKGQNGNDATGVQGPQGPEGSQGPSGAQGPAAGGSSLSLTTSNSGNHYLIGCTGTSTAATTLSSSNTHRAGAATGSGIYWTGWNLYASSDERLKDFYDDVEVDLDKIKTLPKKYFRWKDKEVDGSKMNIGTSAQKLRELYPELVSGEDDGTLGVCYEKLSVVALAAVDKLHEENEELKKKYEDLENRLKELEKLLLK